MLATLKRGAVWCLDIPFALLQWVALALMRGALLVVGLLVVAVAVLFAVPSVSLIDGRPIFNLPRWAWLWGNDFDGLDGDKRAWWAANCDALVFWGLLPWLRAKGVPLGSLPVTSWLARWWWAAIRNPVNNLRLVPWLGCPVSECDIAFLGDYTVEDKPGQGGWQFVRATLRGGRSRWYGFYAVRVTSATTAAVLRLGFKVKPAHQDSNEPAKGMTFKVNPAKDI